MNYNVGDIIKIDLTHNGVFILTENYAFAKITWINLTKELNKLDWDVSVVYITGGLTGLGGIYTETEFKKYAKVFIKAKE